jgi:hypothetical protein
MNRIEKYSTASRIDVSSPSNVRMQIVQSDAFQLFDEAEFPAAPQYQESYFHEVQRGFEEMRRKRVVIAGLARNVAEILPATIARIEAMGNCFADYSVVIYENDSSDITPDLLNYWQQGNRRVTIVSENCGDPQNRPIRCSERAQRMAAYRARCQQTILEKHSDRDFVILVDTDLQGGWSLEGVATTFAKSEWDFVGSNGIIYRRHGLVPNRYVQYDAWAYRTSDSFEPIPTKIVNEITFERGQPFVPVRSCFGGLGIYTMQAYSRGRYEGEDIEHVGFHRSLVRQGLDRFFLNPSQLVVYGRKHRKMDPLVAGFMTTLESIGVVSSTGWRFPKQAAIEQTNSELARSA